MDLREKVVVVTGGSGAIGGATAIAFADLGAHVVVNSRSRAAEGERIAEQVRSRGVRALHIPADLAEKEQSAALFAETVHAFGRVDVVVAAAGATVGGGSFGSLSRADWISAIDNNLMTAVHTAQDAVRVMRESTAPGRIIMIGSVRGLQHCGREGIMAYSAAKAAVASLASTLAKDVAPQILVNCVAPGFVYTPNYEGMSDELKANFVNSTLIRRFITTDEIAQTIVSLAHSDCITGQTIVVDGGFSLKMA